MAGIIVLQPFYIFFFYNRGVQYGNNNDTVNREYLTFGSHYSASENLDKIILLISKERTKEFFYTFIYLHISCAGMSQRYRMVTWASHKLMSIIC